jgi:hypothetical protein
MTMAHTHRILIAAAIAATSATAPRSRADEPTDYVSAAILFPESQEVLTRGRYSWQRTPVTFSDLKALSRKRRNEKPLVDFAFSFSRAIEAPRGRRGGFQFQAAALNQPPASHIQREEELLSELRAREAQIADDLDVEASITEAPGKVRGERIEALDSGPIELERAWKPAPAEPKEGWSGMSLAAAAHAARETAQAASGRRESVRAPITDVALRFRDEVAFESGVTFVR